MKSKITFLLSALCTVLIGQPSQSNIYRVLSEINLLRSSGYTCGKKWMPPTNPVKWNKELYQVSNSYARYLARNRHFDHISLEGEDLGDRLSKIGFEWIKVGENLGYGYYDFYAVFEAWKVSPSHCAMLMDPDVTDMGLSKHNIYWVQSFSKAPSSVASLSAY